MNDTIKALMQQKKYDVRIVERCGVGYMVYMGNGKGMSVIDKRLEGTGLRCDRYGRYMDKGFYLYVVEVAE